MPAIPNYLVSREKAIQQYEAAWHLLNVTFPSVKDPHLLLGIIGNLAVSLEHAMDAILAFERELQLVPAYSNDFQNKFNTFRSKSMRRNNIAPEYLDLMLELRGIMESHQKSPIEFQRHDRFVVASKDYQLQFVTSKVVRDYANQAKSFLHAMEMVLNRKP